MVPSGTDSCIFIMEEFVSAKLMIRQRKGFSCIVGWSYTITDGGTSNQIQLPAVFWLDVEECLGWKGLVLDL